MTKSLAEILRQRAEVIREEAKAASNQGHWDRAVRLSQEALELRLKAMLRATGCEPEKTHDLISLANKAEIKLSKEEASHLDRLTNLRAVSFYEEASELSETDADQALEILEMLFSKL